MPQYNNNLIHIALLSYVQGALQSYKHLQIYKHILLYLKWLKKGKIKTKKKLKPYIQIYINNDLLLLNLANKYVINDL